MQLVWAPEKRPNDQRNARAHTEQMIEMWLHQFGCICFFVIDYRLLLLLSLLWLPWPPFLGLLFVSGLFSLEIDVTLTATLRRCGRCGFVSGYNFIFHFYVLIRFWLLVCWSVGRLRITAFLFTLSLCLAMKVILIKSMLTKNEKKRNEKKLEKCNWKVRVCTRKYNDGGRERENGMEQIFSNGKRRTVAKIYASESCPWPDASKPPPFVVNVQAQRTSSTREL